MWDLWNTVFYKVLGHAKHSLVSELRDTRNKWAHQKAFSTDNLYRARDNIHLLLTSISAEEASEIERQKQEVLRVRFEEQARKETRKAAVAPIEGQPAAGLLPWRKVVTPHANVLSDSQIKLGCVQTGESVATFGYALRRLTDQATYPYQNDKRYWYSTQPSVARLAQDRADQYDDDTIFEEILNLDAFQRNQAKTKRDETNKIVTTRIPEIYTWLLMPN